MSELNQLEKTQLHVCLKFTKYKMQHIYVYTVRLLQMPLTVLIHGVSKNVPHGIVHIVAECQPIFF